MSVLSRPVLHRATTPTQRKQSIPLPRTGPTSEGVPPADAPSVSASTVDTASAQLAPARKTRRRGPVLVAAGAVVALAVGAGAYAALDSSDPATVIAPAVVNGPSETDIARDRAAELRGSKAAAAIGSDARRLTEARRDAAMLQRQRSVQP